MPKTYYLYILAENEGTDQRWTDAATFEAESISDAVWQAATYLGELRLEQAPTGFQVLDHHLSELK